MKRHPALWKEGVAVVCAMSWCLGSVELVACTKLCGDGGLKNVASAVLNSRCRLVRAYYGKLFVTTAPRSR